MRRIGDKPMSGAQRQAKYRARLAREARLKPPAPPPPGFEDVPTPDEMLRLLGLDPAGFPVLSNDQLAELRAQPGGADPFESDGDQPALDEFGEPIFLNALPGGDDPADFDPYEED